jgi:hypothetical protein
MAKSEFFYWFSPKLIVVLPPFVYMDLHPGRLLSNFNKPKSPDRAPSIQDHRSGR